MLDAILYHSVCGHTKKYALALSERLNVPAYSLKEAKKNCQKAVRFYSCLGFVKTSWFDSNG